MRPTVCPSGDTTSGTAIQESYRFLFPSLMILLKIDMLFFQAFLPGAEATEISVPRGARHRPHSHRHTSCSEGAGLCYVMS